MTARASERREEQLAAIPPDEERLVLATGRYIGEGFDDARLDTLFLALPVSWKGTLVQYTGRLHRLHPGKTEVRIFDYVDREVPMLLRMFEKRLRGYRAIGYARGEAPLGYGEASGHVAVEYDSQDRMAGHVRLLLRRRLWETGRRRRREGGRDAARSAPRLNAMIEEATVDAYGESEQVAGFYTMLDEHLALPFETTVLGIPVTVKGVDSPTRRDRRHLHPRSRAAGDPDPRSAAPIAAARRRRVDRGLPLLGWPGLTPRPPTRAAKPGCPSQPLTVDWSPSGATAMGWESVVYAREDLFQQVWDEPVTHVAKRIGISDVALAKICRSMGIPLPGRGYWARKAAGHAPPRPQLKAPQPRMPVSYVRHRFEGDPATAAGDEIRAEVARQAVAVPTRPVPDALDDPHPLVARSLPILQRAERRLGEVLHKHRCLDVSAQGAALDRACRIMDTVLRELEARGHSIEVTAPKGEGKEREPSRTLVHVGDSSVQIGIDEAVDKIPLPLPEPRKAERTVRLRPASEA